MMRFVLRSSMAIALLLLLAGCGSSSTKPAAGCVETPENPTVLLTLLGGAVALPFWRRRK